VAPEDTAPSEEAAEEPIDDAVAEPETVHGALVTWSRGQRVLHAGRDGLVDLVRTLRDEGWLMCLDVTAVDYLLADAPRPLPDGVEPERYELVVTLMSHVERDRVRIRVQIPADDPVAPSLFELHPASVQLKASTTIAGLCMSVLLVQAGARRQPAGELTRSTSYKEKGLSLHGYPCALTM